MGVAYSGDQPRPYRKVAVPRRSQILGFPSVYAHTLSRRTTKFDLVTLGEGRVYCGQPRVPSQESGVPGLPIFEVLLYLCQHPLTQNGQIRHGNTYMGRGVYLGG